jgi:hypothetical protein
MNIESAIDNVLPQSSLFFKDSGLWDYYRSDDDFTEGRIYQSQMCSESFSQFVNRIIETLIKEEADSNDPEPLVTIDYAIYSNRP